jgi:hypothetical protein
MGGTNTAQALAQHAHAGAMYAVYLCSACEWVPRVVRERGCWPAAKHVTTKQADGGT